VNLRDRIDRIRDSVLVGDLVTFLGGEVEPSYGEWQKTRCPFHHDEVPSAGTNNVAGRFVCHACAVRGDVVDLARVYLESTTGEHVPFEEVLRWLEDRWVG